MADHALRHRVERLLNGPFVPEDLTRLFLALRDRSGGRETVIEIGDFAAHSDVRFKGIITRSVRDFFIFLRFRVPTLGSKIDIDNLPMNFPEVLRAGFRRLDSGKLKADTGLKRSTAERLLTVLISKLIPNGNALLLPCLTENEYSLLLCALKYISAKQAFTGDRLYDEFAGALLQNKLLSKADLPRSLLIKPAIILFAISLMHHCEIDLGDGSRATLAASPEIDDGTIGVYATSTVYSPKARGDVYISCPIFTTSLRKVDHCEPNLLGEEHGRRWQCAIEVTGRKTLARLG